MFYAKEVPTGSILIIEGISPRLRIDNSRIAFFREIYSQGKEDLVFEIPPVEVSLVQTGEPGKEVFALEDGMHRLLAQKEMKLKKIRAKIRTHMPISETELTSREVKKYLIMKACEANARHGMPLTNEERKEAVQKMFVYGCTGDEIIATGIAAKASIYRWLQTEVRERKEKAADERFNKKEQIKTLLMQGASLKKIIRDTGIPRTTARRIINEAAKEGQEVAASLKEKSGQPYKWISIDEHANTPDLEGPGNYASEGNFTHVDGPGREPAKKKINDIYDGIRLLEVNDATDYEIKITVLPLLEQKFPCVSRIIKDGSYAIEMEELHYELKAAREELQTLRKELLMKNELLQEKNDQLKKRIEICNYQCEFTTERLGLEFEKYVGFMVTHINEHIQAIPRISQKDESILRQLTANSIFALLSVLEWGDDNGLTSRKIKEKFEEFKESISTFDINNGISGRIELLEKIYYKLPGMRQAAN